MFTGTLHYCEQMESASFGERLRAIREGRYIRRGRKIPLRELADRAGLAFSTISQWETGARWKDKAPPGDDLKRIAEVLEVTVGQLVGSEGPQADEEIPWYVSASDEELMERAGIMIAPVQLAAFVEELSLHGGEFGSPIPQDLEDTFGRILRYEPRKGDPIRWFRFFGSCMEPRISDRDWVFIDRDLPLEPGKFVAAVLHGDQAVARKLTKVKGRFWLETLDGAPPELVTDGVRIIGRIRHRQSSFD